MYHSLSSAHSRGAVLDATAEKTLTAREHDLYLAVMDFVKDAYSERNRLAHWCWGYCDEFPDGLILIDPTHRMRYLAKNFKNQKPHTPLDLRHMYLVKKHDAEAILARFTPVLRYLSLLGGAIWRSNSEGERAGLRRKLFAEPEIEKWLDRLNSERLQKNEEFLQRSRLPRPPREPSAKQRRETAMKRAAEK